MSRQWREVIRIDFKGGRFSEAALNLPALTELLRFQRIVAETAKTIYRENYPGRNLPARFDTRTQLWLRRIESGSTSVPLEIPICDTSQPDLFEPPLAEIEEAAALAYATYRAIETNEPISEKFPKVLVPQYAEFGNELDDEETIELVPPRYVRGDNKPALITRSTKCHWDKFRDLNYIAYADITGQVLMVDVKHRRSQIWVDERTSVQIGFSPEQEEHVTTALKEHDTRRIRARGRGEYSAQGKLARIIEVEELAFARDEEPSYDLFTRPIEEVIAELARQIPDKDWRELPRDLSENLDHYLYGEPKQ